MNDLSPIPGGLAYYDGWYWPADDTDARAVILRDCAPDIAALLPHVPERRVIVQAGANVGVYALALADRFNRVVTFEPDPTNWACLTRNLTARDALRRVVARHAALGEAPGVCEPTEVSPANCGAHRVAYDRGTVPVVTIDSLNLGRCDCIWLDVEGAELFALKGAAETIRRFSPTICCEDKGLDARFFGVGRGMLQTFLAERGYAEVVRFGRDKIFRKATT